MLLKIAPILPALNISDTNLFYRNKLKFGTHNYGNYLLVFKDQLEIHFYEWADPLNFLPSSCYIFDDNIPDLYARFSSMDIIYPKGILRTNSWGKQEFQVVDNNGNTLKFASGR
ncbi:MAG: hypothetical protein ABIO04_07330 [Ferruginibacter sp.]